MIRKKDYSLGSDYREVEVFNLAPNKKPYTRARRKQESSPQQKQLNSKRRVREFVRLAITNFGRGDFGVELTPDEKHLPEDKAGMKRLVKNYVKRLRKRIKADGGDPDKLKYLYVISDMDGETGEKKRLHIHTFIAGATWEQITDTFELYGYANADKLYEGDHGIAAKAHYYAKQMRSDETLEKNYRSWGSSKNLVKPELTVSDRAITKSQLDRIVNDPSDFTYIEKLLNKGRKVKYFVTMCHVDRDGRQLFGSEIDTGEGMGYSLYIQMQRQRPRR